MGHRLRHRHPAQIAVIAPFAIVALIGVVGLALDIGMFRLIDSELENAADAAALAAVWYDPVCPSNPGDPANDDLRCAPDNAHGMMASIAQQFAEHNFGLAKALCGSTPTIDPVRDVIWHPIQTPNARAVTVIVHCHAEYLAGRILGLNSGTEITRWATAAIGDEVDVTAADGTTRRTMAQYLAAPGSTCCLIAALVPQ